MAEIILGSVVDSITGHLVSLVSDEIGLARGVRLELQKLRDTVSIIGGVLREAEKRQVEAEDVKEWLKSLRDVAYDADDLLDDFSTEAMRRGRVLRRGKRIANKVRIFFSSSNQLIYANKMAHRVKDIRERLEAIRIDSGHFQLQRISNFRNLVENRVRPETYPSEPEPYVIGRDKDKKEVIDFLLNPDFEENVSILPIVGFGGMGKTTLARSVFNDESVRGHFEVKLWICVSTNFDVEDILRKTVRECSRNNEQLQNANMNRSADKDCRNLNDELAKLDMNQLRERLGAWLDGKRFFMVLDDVWNENRREWLKLEDSLRNGAKGSKILVTTRTPRVAKTMAATFHQLSGLPEQESLSLLMRMAMKQEHEWRGQNLEKIALDILKKCVGVPLAITTIGRLLLFSRNTEEDWSNFMNHDLSRINQEEGDIMQSLNLSYDFLPSHLKQCFSYCSLFPKDHELNPFDLIHLWMSQGFIKSSGNRKTLEEVGQEYFMELVSRSFFQDLKEDVYGNITGCKMHDLMHDLAMLVAGDNCIAIDSENSGKIPEEARHVSMVNVKGDELKLLNQRIRSLLLISESIWSETSFSNISCLNISCLRNLRALCLLNVHVDVSGLIGKLKHLRSLDLSGNLELRSLPNSISRLCNLETLNLRECRNLISLPRGITKLANLRQLDVSGCRKLKHMPRGIGNLTSLQMLSTFVVRKKWNPNAATLNELGKLIRLRRELVIQNLGTLGSISSELDASFSIENLGLQSLELNWNGWRREAKHEEALKRLRPHPDLKRLTIRFYDGAKLSSWVTQLHKLVEIEIRCCYNCKHLPSLHHLPHLKRISLSSIYHLEWMELWESETTQQSFFPSLEVLELEFLSKFKGWKWRRVNVNRIEEGNQEENTEDSSCLSLLPTFSDKVKVIVKKCPKISYMHKQELRLTWNGIKNPWQSPENVTTHTSHSLTPVISPPSMMTFISISSIPLLGPEITSLTIHELENVEHLPVEFFQSLPSLQYLRISECSHLKSLPGRAIIQYFIALETLEICQCEELDLSTEDKEGDEIGEGMHDHHKLCKLEITGIGKMESLPGWIRYFSNLKDLRISNCLGLKSLPARSILPLLTILEQLELEWCPELDLTGESEDQENIPALQFCGPTKLQKLVFMGIERMKTLPWWIQHLPTLESLHLLGCNNMEALPEWFSQLTSLKRLHVNSCKKLSKRYQKKGGKDWPKISHIQDVLFI